MKCRAWAISLGLALLAVVGAAQTKVPAESKSRCLDDLSAHLEARLKELADRWDKIPAPAVPVSGRSSEEVLAVASEEEKSLVSEWIKFLAQSPSADRAALINVEIRSRPLSEVDVWLPEKLTGDLKDKSPEERTLYLEAWLDWAEALGRKDTLLTAASTGMEQLALREESRGLLEIASRWTNLAFPDHAARGRAEVFAGYADRLFRAGENEKALDSYRSSARKLFAGVGDRRGQANTLLGEGDVAAELVALEACDTERGNTRQSDERLDLTRAFLTAGAASVLSTRWKVPDEPATTRFLFDFYRAYRQGGLSGQALRKDEALSEARRRSRERGDPAQIWAAWVLVGDAR